MNRFQLLVRRFFRARSFGVRFTGTTGFTIPSAVRLCGRELRLAVPPEVGAGLDFINLALDDEYGLRDLPYQPRTILDIGANFGLFSVLAAHYCRDAHIHAYEPNPRIFPTAAKNLALIKGTLFQEGIGSCTGLAKIREFGDSHLAQTIMDQNGAVRITALRDAIARIGAGVDLLKLDCEGAEWDILQDKTSFQKIRLVRMEYHLVGERHLDDLTALVGTLGFQIDRLLPNHRVGIVWFSKP